MHNHQAKIAIVISTLIVICLGGFSQILHMAPLVPSARATLMANTREPISNRTWALSAQPVQVLSGGSSDQKVALTAVQPLGELASISWDNFSAADTPAAYNKFLAIPLYEEYNSQFSMAGEYSDQIDDSSVVMTVFARENSQVNDFYFMSTSHEDLEFRCAACHGMPSIIIVNHKSTDGDYLTQAQGHAGLEVECELCHSQRHEQVSWQLRGVE